MMKLAIVMVLFLLMPVYVVVAQEEGQWNETLPVPPTGTQIVLRHVNKGDLLEGNFTTEGGPVNFYVILAEPFISQVEYGTNRTDVPIYKANLKTEDNFSIAIPFDGTLVAAFENPRTITPVNVTYSMNYTEGGASYLRQGRIYDDIVVLSPRDNTAVIAIPYVFVGDAMEIRVYSLDGPVSVYVTLDTTVDRERLPAYYREIYPLISQSIMNETTIIDQNVFASGTAVIYINNPTVNSNRTVVYSIRCAERGPIMRVVLSGIEHGQCILPLGFSPDIPFKELTTGFLLQSTISIYETLSRLYHFLTGLALIGGIIETIWNFIYGLLMPLWAF
ncbi:MAG: hypothetical protein SVE93_05525 [Candidatus Thermoplasmatota archaeon]|nr:hypothetical protein [Candidatus Thermoplasmatota archaeon]